MGKRGPPPRLAALKKLDGNPGGRVIIEPAIIAFGEPFIPDHLPEDAQACVELIKASMPPKVYAGLDGFLLADYGTWWGWHKAAVHEMSSPEFQPLTPGSTGQMQMNPWFLILKMASQRMQAIGMRLGLDPVARAALHIPQGPRPVSKYDGLIGRKGSSLSLSASPSQAA